MKYECDKCGKSYNKEDMVIDMTISLCKDCYDVVENETTFCNRCIHFYIDNDIIDDYPTCRNKDSKYYGEDDFHIPSPCDCNCIEPF